MKRKLLFPFVLIAGLLFINFSVCQVYGQTSQTKQTQQTTVKYTCTMHPEVVQAQPGNCPICGKKLVEKKAIMKEGMKQVIDSTKMKSGPGKIKVDSTMKKVQMKPDTAMMQHDLR